MSKPCQHDPPDLPPPGEPYSVAYCRPCWLYEHDIAYRSLWGGTTTPADKLASQGGAARILPGKIRHPVCVHLETERVLDRRGKACQHCWVTGCEIHGKCTTGEKVDGVAFCPECKSYCPEEVSVFERVCLINLARRTDRLSAFRQCQAENGWRLPEVEVFQAIHGDTVGVPTYFQSGGGAWGCCRSHVSILERAVMDGVNTLLVLEDDLYWKTTAWSALVAFMASVPDDWDQLMLGGQHIHQAFRVNDLVVRCRNTQRTHAYAVRGPAMKELLRLWYTCPTHIDWAMGAWQTKYHVYAPTDFIFGQGGSKSDISGHVDQRVIWNGAQEAPVVYLEAPSAVVEQLRSHGFHCGYTRNAEGLDLGLCAIAGESSANQASKLRRWLTTVGWEATAEEGCIATVYHPDIPLSLVQSVTSPVIHIHGQTVKECLNQAKGYNLNLKAYFFSTHVLLLRGPREVADGLGLFHRGYWIDPETGEDRGQQEAAGLHGLERHKRLQQWLAETSSECEKMRAVPMIWHDSFNLAEIQKALPSRRVVEITAQTPREAVRLWQEALSS